MWQVQNRCHSPSAGIQEHAALRSRGISAGLQQEKAWGEFFQALSSNYIYLFHLETKRWGILICNQKMKVLLTLQVIETTLIFWFKKPSSMSVVRSAQTDANQPAEVHKATYTHKHFARKNVADIYDCCSDTHNFSQLINSESLVTSKPAVFQAWSFPKCGFWGWLDQKQLRSFQQYGQK